MSFGRFFEHGSSQMKFANSKIVPIYALLSMMLLSDIQSHPSLKDRPIKIFFHCGNNAFARMDAEGRGGLGSLLSYVEEEKLNHEKKNGRAYLLFPFLDPKDKFLNSFPFDGYQKNKMKLLELENIKLGLGFLSAFETNEETFDMDAWIYFATDMENKNGMPKFPEDKNLPFFIIKTQDTAEASFKYLSNVHEIHCPSEFGKLGVLDLYFRNRDLIRIHHEVQSINLISRNRSWRIKHHSVDESQLPVSVSEKKDKPLQERKSDNPYASPRNSYDREISGTAKSFDRILGAEAP